MMNEGKSQATMAQHSVARLTEYLSRLRVLKVRRLDGLTHSVDKSTESSDRNNYTQESYKKSTFFSRYVRFSVTVSAQTRCGNETKADSRDVNALLVERDDERGDGEEGCTITCSCTSKN